jgi:glycerol dehydrogenase
MVCDQVTASFAEAGLPLTRSPFGRFTTVNAINQIANRARELRADIVVGIGGGSTLDTAKAAGYKAGARWATVPTLAATDAACTAMSVIYNEQGGFSEYRFFPHNPDLVLVDSAVIARAPLRFLVAGIGDALATWIETRATQQTYGSTMAGGLTTDAALALAQLSWKTLWDNALPAISDMRQHLLTPAVEHVIEANVLLSGIGFESGGLAAAHAIHNGLTTAPQTHGLTHGQKVNIGAITQLILEGAPNSEIDDFILFTTRLGLPTSLTEVGLNSDDVASLTRVAQVATADGETIHCLPFTVTVTDVVDSLRALEGRSRAVRTAAGLEAPVPYMEAYRPRLR